MPPPPPALKAAPPAAAVAEGVSERGAGPSVVLVAGGVIVRVEIAPDTQASPVFAEGATSTRQSEASPPKLAGSGSPTGAGGLAAERRAAVV